jgi:DNA-binding Xre family transcriptional regulator
VGTAYIKPEYFGRGIYLMKKTDLLKAANLSPPTLAKLSKNKPIDTRTLDKICAALQCQPGDVIEYVPD